MACSRLPYSILAVMMCLAVVIPRTQQHICDNCNNAKCQEVCSGSPYGPLGKRTVPRIPNFAAYIQDRVRRQRPESCGILDIYRAIPSGCHAQLDWLVSNTKESLVRDE